MFGKTIKHGLKSGEWELWVRTNMQPFDSKNHADSTRSVSGYFVPGLVSKIVHSYLYLQEIIFIFPMKCRVYSLSSPAKCAISESLAHPDLKALSPYFHASLTQRLLRMTRKPEAEDWCPPTNLRICNDCNVPLGSLGHVGFFESDK